MLDREGAAGIIYWVATLDSQTETEGTDINTNLLEVGFGQNVLCVNTVCFSLFLTCKMNLCV